MKKIDNLTVGDVIACEIDSRLIKKLHFVMVKIEAYENLFKSYINSTTEEANKINLKNFLDLYTNLIEEKENLQMLIIKKTLGDKKYNLINSMYGYKYNIDFEPAILTITIQLVKERD